MRNHLGLVLCVALALGAPGSWAAAPAAPPFKIVVNAKNPVQSLSREKAAAIFLKKSTTWPEGGTAQPVDLPEDSPARKAFSQEVLKKSVPAVVAYWQQRIFSGRDLPPPEKASDEEVVAYVKSNERAIGYVSGTADVTGVKVITVSE